MLFKKFSIKVFRMHFSHRWMFLNYIFKYFILYIRSYPHNIPICTNILNRKKTNTTKWYTCCVLHLKYQQYIKHAKRPLALFQHEFHHELALVSPMRKVSTNMGNIPRKANCICECVYICARNVSKYDIHVCKSSTYIRNVLQIHSKPN